MFTDVMDKVATVQRDVKDMESIWARRHLIQTGINIVFLIAIVLLWIIK